MPQTSIWVLVALSLITALSPGCVTPDEDGPLMVLRASLPEEPASLDPAVAYDQYTGPVVAAIYETLYQYAYLSDHYEIIPLLAADSPKLSRDRLTVTIPIRRGVRFQDNEIFKDGRGRELRAQDFIYSLKRLALPALMSPGWWTLDGRVVGINVFRERLVKAAENKDGKLDDVFMEPLEGIRALDDYTLQIKLVKPYPQLLYVLAMSFTAPVPNESVAASSDRTGGIRDHLVGTGPYVLRTWEHGHRLILERNPTYHTDFYPTDAAAAFRKRGYLTDMSKPLPFLDRIDLEIIREPNDAWSLFLSDKLDLVSIPKDKFASAVVNSASLTPAFAQKGVRLQMEPGTSFYFLTFNMDDKLVGSNKSLRQAISSAIDREKWIERFTSGRGHKQVNSLPPGIPDRPATSRIKYDYSVKNSREFLKKAGYPGGKGLPAISLDMRGTDATSRQLGDFFKEQLASVGIRVNVVYNTLPAFLDKLKKNRLQLSYSGWSMDYPDADNVMQLLYGPYRTPGPNEANYNSPEMNKWYEQMTILEPGTKRAELIRKMDDLLQEDCPWALGYYHTDYMLTQPWILNYRPNDIIMTKFKYLRVNKEVKKRYLE